MYVNQNTWLSQDFIPLNLRMYLKEEERHERLTRERRLFSSLISEKLISDCFSCRERPYSCENVQVLLIDSLIAKLQPHTQIGKQQDRHDRHFHREVEPTSRERTRFR